MLCVCQVFRNSLVFEVGIYVCRHICVCLCVICMPSQMMPDVFYLSDSPASWWRFAFNVVLSRVTEHTRRQTWAFVASRAQLNVRYVRAYTRKLTDPVLDADMSVSCHLCVSAASLPTPMLVNSDGWDGDHSSSGGGWRPLLTWWGMGCDAFVVVVDCESAFT